MTATGLSLVHRADVGHRMLLVVVYNDKHKKNTVAFSSTRYSTTTWVRVRIQADSDEAFEMPRCRTFRRPMQHRFPASPAQSGALDNSI